MIEITSEHRIGIAGAGTMGQGIAHLALAAGHPTLLFDIDVAMLEKARGAIQKTISQSIERGQLQGNSAEYMKRLELVNQASGLKAEVIIEAIVEKTDIKHGLYRVLESENSDQTIIASNTSSIPITQLATGLKYPERFVGMHFFNPAHIMKLVEVISGVATLPEVAQKIAGLAELWGRRPVFANDSPGFIVNRVARHYYVESLRLLEEGAADHETIDRILEAQGFKMGAFKLMDLIGVDTNFSVTSTMYQQFFQEVRFRPSRTQQLKVQAGHHGRKSGKGFYDYSS
jgi:3-hydroxybutyryl-CoA dehydrogenase